MGQATVPVSILYLTTGENEVKAATRLLVIQTMGAELKNNLKRYVKESGPAPVGDVVYDPNTSTSFELDRPSDPIVFPASATSTSRLSHISTLLQ